MLIACHDCGLLHKFPEAGGSVVAGCTRCGGVLRRYRPNGISHAFALNLAALLLFGVANALPLMTLSLAGRQQGATLFESVLGLYRYGVWELAGLVLLVAIAFPLLRVVGSLWVLAHLRMGRVNGTLAPVFRIVETLRPWAMTEVYLLGLIVAWVKLRDLANLEIGLALLAFVTFIIVMVWASAALDVTEVWDRIAPQARRRDAGSSPFMACHICRQLVQAHEGHGSSRCPRCRAPVHDRKPNSLARASALVIAAAILYVPANL